MSDHDEIPLTGSIPIAVGQPAVVRIPIPGEHRLAVEFWTSDPKWKSTSTSTLFIQDPTGTKKVLRLDYGFNVKTQTVDFHWNRKGLGTDARFGRRGSADPLADHTTVGRLGRTVYRAARAYRWLGRVMVVVGVVVDGVSIVEADHPIRRATEVASAWSLAWAGCRAGGFLFGGGGTAVEPGFGTAIGAIGGCVIFGYGGYRLGEKLGDVAYEWAANTVFTRLPEVDVPWHLLR